MSLETQPLTVEPELLLPDQEPSNLLEAATPIFGLRRRVMSRIAGPLVVTAVVVGTSVAPMAEDLSELGIHDAKIAMGWGPQLEFHNYTATEAVSETYQAFHLNEGYYIDNIGSISGYASAWHQYQLINMLRIADILNPDQGYDQKLKQALDSINQTYWDSSPAGYPAGYDAGRDFGLTAPERYVDDNLWLGQALWHEYQKTGDEAYVDRVGKIMDLFMSQQDTDNGGAYWKVQLPTETDRGRVMVSNATAIPTLVEMYSSGHGDASYLASAEQTYNWIQQLRDPITGLYFDSFMSNGQPEKTIYTYVQGEALKSMVELNKVDKVRYPLSTAINFAETTLDYFSDHNTYSIGKFNAIYFPTVMHLAGIVNNPVLTKKVEEGLALAKNAIPNSPSSLADAAAAAAILALSEMPFSKWASLN